MSKTKFHVGISISKYMLSHTFSILTAQTRAKVWLKYTTVVWMWMKKKQNNCFKIVLLNIFIYSLISLECLTDWKILLKFFPHFCIFRQLVSMMMCINRFVTTISNLDNKFGSKMLIKRWFDHDFSWHLNLNQFNRLSLVDWLLVQ